jgi:hypothetical protein
LTEARLKQQGAEKVVQIQQERAERLELAGGGVSRAEVDAAHVQLAEARTQLKVAQAAVKQWQDALAAIGGQGSEDATWSQPLAVPMAGEVVDVAGLPGLTVQPGDLVARVVDPRHVLVRLDLPPEALAAGRPAARWLALPSSGSPEEWLPPSPKPAGHEPNVRATPVGPAPQVGPASQLAAYWYEITTAAGADAGKGPARASVWRPGLFVKGYLPAAGAEERAAVAVPDGALLYVKDDTVVFVRTGPGTFQRRTVRVLGREGGEWVLAEGVRPGEAVVSRRAQVLLSAQVQGAGGEADND